MRIGWAAAVLVGAQVAAAQAPERVAVLSLDDALRRTDRFSPDLVAARARLREAETGVGRAWAALGPRVDVFGSYTRNSQQVVLDFEAFVASGNEVPPPVIILQRNQLDARLEGSMPLFNPRLFPQLANARDRSDAAAAEYRQARRDLLARVAEAYLAALANEALVAATERQVALTQEQEKVAQARVDAGEALPTTAMRARLDRLRAESSRERARNALAAARVTLATLAWVEPAFKLVPVESAAVAAPEGTVEMLVQRALAERPDVVARRLAAEIAAREAIDAWLTFVPSLGLSGIVSATNAPGFGPAIFGGVSVNVTVPIYDGGRYPATIRASAAEEEAIARTLALEREVAAEIERARLDLDSARARRDTDREAVELARQNVSLVFAQYRAGTATAVDLSDATNALARAEADAVRSDVDLQLAALRLARSAGTFRPGE